VLPPTLKIIPANGLGLALWEWAGADPPLLLAHATGFHGRIWDHIVRMFPGRRCLAVDFRGHGRSSQPDPPYHWPAFGRDLAAMAERLEIADAIGIGHSMGGHSIVAAALLRPQTFRALLLIDPTIFPRAHYGKPPLDTSFVLRRRDRWRSPEEMFERFRHRAPFALWREEILRDYCEYALVAREGEFVLACPPAVEASIYEHSNAPEADLYPRIPSLAIPAVVMRAGGAQGHVVLDPSASPTAPDLAAQFPRGRDVLLEERSHFIPMEAPELVAEEIRPLLPE